MKTVKLKTALLLEGNNEVQKVGTVHELEDGQADGLLAQGYAEEYVPEPEVETKGKGK